jgi:hypothetical protein
MNIKHCKVSVSAIVHPSETRQLFVSIMQRAKADDTYEFCEVSDGCDVVVLHLFWGADGNVGEDECS